MKHQKTPFLKFGLTFLLIFWMGLLLRPSAQGAPMLEGELAEKLEALRTIDLTMPRPTAKEQLIARSVVQTTLAKHYNFQTFTPQLSCEWYQGYFELLDGGKNLFLQSDLDEFQELADNLYSPQGHVVQLDFAYQVYQKFLERYREYVLFKGEELFRDQDFTVEESLPIGHKREEIQWAASLEELQERWRLDVKNTLLGDLLNQEQLASDEKPAEDEAKTIVTRRREDVRTRTLRSLVSTFFVRTEVTSMDILELYLNAFLHLFDPHTTYMAPESKEDFDISMSLSLQGIGATLSWKDGYTTVSSLVPGGPAARDGRLKSGDRILAVAQSSEEEPLDVVGMKLSHVVQHIRGPKGTEVFLTVQPEGSSDTVVYRLVREQIVLKDSEAQSYIHSVPVAGRATPARVVQLYLPSFYSDFGARERGEKDYKSTSKDLERLLTAAKTAGPVDGVILDLRGNGGGALDEAVALCGLFARRGPVVQVRNQQGGVNVLQSFARAPIYTGPMLVMVDRESASASEIVAAYLQDNARAVIVGDESTHGKGTVQTVLDLSSQPQLAKSKILLGNQDPGSLKLTFAKFYRVNGGSTQERGVEPDIVFPSFLVYMDTSEKTLSHCLPWDEIRPARFSQQTRLAQYLPTLQGFAMDYMSQNVDFQEFTNNVDAYRQWRDIKALPLEINARRAYREREQHLIRTLRRFRAQHPTEDKETETPEALKSDEEKLLEMQKLPTKDVALEAALAIMGREIELDEENDNAFSLK